jgi:hypothetical protein
LDLIDRPPTEQTDERTALGALLRREERRIEQLTRVVIPIGVRLAYETDHNRLLEQILVEAMRLCHADGGTLYLRTEQDTLQYAIMRTESLQLAQGGTTGLEIEREPIALFDPATQNPNHGRVSAYAALTGQSVNVEDVYCVETFDFSGPRAFDKATGYRTKSVLAIPLRDNDGRISGVVQLVNARCPLTSAVVVFDPHTQEVVECLCLLAGAALTSYVSQQRLKDQVRQLKIEIDQTKRDQEVRQITTSDYFKALQSRAKELQSRAHGK